MTKLTATATVFVAAMTMASATFAQPAAATAPAGHWEGAIEVPAQPLAIQVDLVKKGDTWEGTITIPAQNVKGLPLGGIQISGDKASFAITGAPGNPTFNGAVAKDGQTISGDFAQGGGTVPFKLTRPGTRRSRRCRRARQSRRTSKGRGPARSTPMASRCAWC